MTQPLHLYPRKEAYDRSATILWCRVVTNLYFYGLPSSTQCDVPSLGVNRLVATFLPLSYVDDVGCCYSCCDDHVSIIGLPLPPPPTQGYPRRDVYRSMFPHTSLPCCFAWHVWASCNSWEMEARGRHSTSGPHLGFCLAHWFLFLIFFVVVGFCFSTGHRW